MEFVGFDAYNRVKKLLTKYPPRISIDRKFREDHLLSSISACTDEMFRNLVVDRTITATMRHVREQPIKDKTSMAHEQRMLPACSLIMQIESEFIYSATKEIFSGVIPKPNIYAGKQQLVLPVPVSLWTLDKMDIYGAVSGRVKNERVGGKKQGYHYTRGYDFSDIAIKKETRHIFVTGEWDILSRSFSIYHYMSQDISNEDMRLVTDVV